MATGYQERRAALLKEREEARARGESPKNAIDTARAKAIKQKEAAAAAAAGSGGTRFSIDEDEATQVIVDETSSGRLDSAPGVHVLVSLLLVKSFRVQRLPLLVVRLAAWLAFPSDLFRHRLDYFYSFLPPPRAPDIACCCA